MAHPDDNSPQIASETLLDLANKLKAALENPNSAKIGTLAEIVGRLRGELSLMSDCQEALAYAPTPDAIAWRELLEQDATSPNLIQELTPDQIDNLAAALASKQSA